MYNITFVKTYMQIYAKKYKDIVILFMFLVIIYLSFESITLLVLLFIKVKKVYVKYMFFEQFLMHVYI